MNKIVNNPEFTDDAVKMETEEKENPEETQDDEKETQEEPSTSEKPDDESEEEETKEEIVDDSKERELQGLEKQEEELVKENSELEIKIKALKDSIVTQRTERREKRDIVDRIDKVTPKEEEASLDDIDPETLKVLDKYTKAKGLVPASELEKRTYEQYHKQAEKTFYERHKEYLPENDKDDTLYKALTKELKTFAKPNNPEEIEQVFEKAHKLVSLQNPQLFKSLPKDITRVKLEKAGLGSGASGGSSGKSDKQGGLSEKQINILRQSGYSEEEIKELNN